MQKFLKDNLTPKTVLKGSLQYARKTIWIKLFFWVLYFCTWDMANILNKTISSPFASVCALMCLYMCVLAAQSCLTLCNPTDCNLPGSCVRGILQARILGWVAIFFSRRSPWPKGWTQVSCVAGRFFTLWATSVSVYVCIYVWYFFFLFYLWIVLLKLIQKELYLIGLKTKKSKTTNKWALKWNKI